MTTSALEQMEIPLGDLAATCRALLALHRKVVECDEALADILSLVQIGLDRIYEDLQEKHEQAVKEAKGQS